MRYFVIAPDGQRYGPADITTLNGWISEGRILAGHELEEEGTGRRVAATSVSGLDFGPAQATSYAQPPTSSPGFPPTASAPITPSLNVSDSDRMVQNSLILGVIGAASLVGFGCCLSTMPIVPLLLSVFGFIQANKAKMLGNPKAQGMLMLNGVVIALAVLRALFGLTNLFGDLGGPW